MSLFFNIIALIFALPLQMASYSKTIAHLSDHQYLSQVHGAEHEHDQHESSDPSNGEHSHSEGGPSHSHAQELSGAMVQAGIFRNDVVFEQKSLFTYIVATFKLDFSKGRIIQFFNLRPPIYS